MSFFSLNFFLVLTLFLSNAFMGTPQSTSENGTVVFKVGAILDLDALVGRIGLSCLSMALSDFYSVHSDYKTRLVLHVRDSKRQITDAAANALELLKDVEVDAIIGPETSAQASFVMDLGERAHVPIISFSATSPSLLSRTSYFVQTAQSDDTQVGPIASIVKAFNWREIVVIHEDTDFGNGVIPYLSNALQEIDARISYRSVIPLSASDDFILAQLYKMMAMQTRVFVVHMSSSLGTRLFLRAKEIGMMTEGFAWIITDELMDLLYSFDSHIVESMQGVLGVKPLIPRSKELDSFVMRWTRKFLQDNPDIKHAEMSNYGLWAYDTVTALAMAAEEVGSKELAIPTNSTNPFRFGLSRTGPKLLKAFKETRFEGISGEFHLVDGQKKSLPFQILNVVGKGEREVGIWTVSGGIFTALEVNKTGSSSTKTAKFRKIIWPGESSLEPKGWQIPATGQKLKIGVPWKEGFTEFVKVEVDPRTNATSTSGFYIEIFDSVMNALPYHVPYEYVPFKVTNGFRGYDDLVYQVHLQELDGAVGDITISANRSMYVDFTLPFADGGISMVVPVTYKDANSYWTFLKPLQRDLWCTSIFFFLLTGLAVWALEHRINTAFRGPPSQHVPMILWFPFSTLVFAHREKLVSNLARLVVTVWLFVVLILSSSYTASLSARLTLQSLQPTVHDVKELKTNEHYVGYEHGSLVADILKEMGFPGSQLKPFTTPDGCHEALKIGSKNGGISAFFGVVPYSRIFTSGGYCGKYTIVGPVYRTDGFGFVFSRNSLLVADVSRALIKFTEGNKILEMEQKRFGIPACIPEDINTDSLSLQSFGGLFAIIGCVTMLCLLIYIAKYAYQNRDQIRRLSATSTSAWSTFRAICRHFDRRDLSSYPFSRRRPSRQNHAMEHKDAGDISNHNDRPISPRSSNASESDTPVGNEDANEHSNQNLEMIIVHQTG